MKFTKITIEDIIGRLADISVARTFKKFENSEYDLYIQAVGFEDRTTAIATKLASTVGFKAREALLIKYHTNIEDNLFFEEDLRKEIRGFTKSISSFSMDEDFTTSIREKIHSSLSPERQIRVIVDFSSLSSGLILSLCRILFLCNIDLTILYAEGAVYHPTNEEFDELIDGKDDEVAFCQTFGIDDVTISPDFNGGSKKDQDLVICFPSFKAERTEAIVTKIDDLILKQKDRERLIWIVGDPHMPEPEKDKRKNIQIKINKIEISDKIYFIDTLDYKKTLAILDHIYQEEALKYHINISDLGSKMQSLGIALFASLRRDITVYYSEPVKYNPSHYSEGVKGLWIIEIGDVKNMYSQLLKVDTIEVNSNH